MAGAAIPLIAAGIQAAAGVAGTVSTGKLNKKNRQWQEDMWNKTNAYNTPVAQMQRFKEAGLNPHLIYGQGSHGNTTMPNAPKQENQNFQPYADTAMQYVAVKKQEAEIKNLEKAQQVMDADINQKKAQAQNLISSSQMTDEEKRQLTDLYDIKKATADMNLRGVGIQNDKMNAEIDKVVQDTKASQQLTSAQISKMESEKQAIKQNMAESAEKIKLMRIEGNNKAIEGEIQRAKADLWKRGINPEASAGQRILKELYEASGLSDAIQGARKHIDGAPVRKLEYQRQDMKDYIEKNYKR